jgi:hypothetical protein
VQFFCTMLWDGAILLLTTLSLCVVLCAYLLHCARLLLCLGPAVIYLAIFALQPVLGWACVRPCLHMAWLVGEVGGVGRGRGVLPLTWRW